MRPATNVNYLCLLLFFAFIVACTKNDGKEHYVEVVNEWQGREIRLPAGLTDLMTGDSVCGAECDYTILSYYDKDGCTGCRMKMPMWQEFMSQLQHLSSEDTNPEVRLLMVVNSSNEPLIRYTIESSRADFSVVLDSLDLVNSLNAFPDQPNWQTFLLDRDMKVVAVGNPVYNTAVADLYRRIISGKETFSALGDAPVSLSAKSLRLDTVRIGETASRDFTVLNHGSDTLTVRKVLTSCDCTTASVSKGTILPGDSITVRVSFREENPETVGPFNRSIQLLYNGYDHPTEMEITGIIIK